ncbi:DUF2252 family protein [Roseibium sediminicola]|uniref:DUF2252 domain-containing protein n=1 Tax=Roseibium sediminicola TaxID=2933272 RepID=A0ABT0H314_9HYPH|nr:DUF2252 family protein [Roseibium sp. CAU 1639]MCK7616074.1 DUF2252 domain-containing protein [Roseibium sp. CAU 1639]
MEARAYRQALISAELERVDGVAPHARPVLDKHAKMALSPFQFLRGSAQIFYADLASGVLQLPEAFLSAPLTRIVGDCHLANFGFFSEEGSYGDTVIWAPNDYDDAGEGPAGFDLMRFCVSLFLAAEYLDGLVAGRYGSDKSFEITSPPAGKDAARAARAFLKAYRKTLEQIAANPENRDGAVKRFGKDHFLRKPLEKARARAPGSKKFEKKSAVAQLTERTRSGFRFDPASDKFARVDQALADELEDVFRPYLEDSILDVARRVGAGTGSLSLDRFYLLVGPDEAPSAASFRETHVVEAKQQQAAALIHHFPDLSPVNRLAPARLTVDCQRRMLRRPDLVLDDVVWNGSAWLLRSRHHTWLTVDPEDLLAATDPAQALKDHARACGSALAFAHARGDLRSVRFEQQVADAVDRSGAELIAAAKKYADLVKSDHGLLSEMIDKPGDTHAA